jgi:hypothetical protein
MYGAYEALSDGLEGAPRRLARGAQPRLLALAPPCRGSADRRAAAQRARRSTTRSSAPTPRPAASACSSAITPSRSSGCPTTRAAR